MYNQKNQIQTKVEIGRETEEEKGKKHNLLCYIKIFWRMVAYSYEINLQDQGGSSRLFFPCVRRCTRSSGDLAVLMCEALMPETSQSLNRTPASWTRGLLTPARCLYTLKHTHQMGLIMIRTVELAMPFLKDCARSHFCITCSFPSTLFII